MNSWVPNQSFDIIDGALSAPQCVEALSRLENLAANRWIQRLTMSPARALKGSTCDYYFACHTTIEDELLEYLISLAPVLEGYQLDEVCINRYEPGQFIGEHTDRGHPRNMVISLVDNPNQGCLINGELMADVAGRAVIHHGLSLPHSVPPVKEKRFVLIYLYHFKGAFQCRHMNALSSG